MDCCEKTYKGTIQEIIQLIDNKNIASIKHLKVILKFVLTELEKKENER